jgi:hypothetical protein
MGVHARTSAHSKQELPRERSFGSRRVALNRTDDWTPQTVIDLYPSACCRSGRCRAKSADTARIFS